MLKRTKKAAAYILAAIMLVSPAAGMVPQEAAAEQVESPSVSFALSDTARIGSVDIVVTDEGGNILNGSKEQTGDGYVFTADGLVDDEGTFYYEAVSDLYEQNGKTAFTFAEGKVDVSLSPVKPGSVSFAYSDGTEADPDSVSFTADGAPISASKSGQTWALEGVYIGDTLSYEATFQKNGKEYKSEGSFKVRKEDMKETLSLDKIPDLKDLTITAKDLSMGYGDKKDLAEGIALPDDYKGKVTYEVVSGAEKASLSGSTLTALGTGDVIVKVSCEEDASYMAASVEIKVSIGKKDLGTISASDVDWENLKKTYDGSSVMDVSGKVKEDVTGSLGTVTVNARLILDGKDVGEHSSTLTNITFGGSEDIALSLPAEEGMGPKAVISPCNVSLSLKDVTVSYGSKEWESIKNGTIPAADILEDPVIDGGAAQGFDKSRISSNIKVFPAGDLLKGTHEGALKAEIVMPVFDNYYLSLEKADASVTVLSEYTGERGLSENIALSEEESLAVYDTGEGRIYVRPGSKAVFKSLDEKYDTVVFVIGGKEYKGSVTSFQEESGAVEGTYYLSVDGSDTRTDAGEEDGEQDFTLPSGYLYVDADAPAVTFKFEKEEKTGIGSLLSSIFFNTADIKASVTVKDDLSGKDTASYKVLSYKSQEELENAIKALSASDDDWIPLPEDGIVRPGSDVKEGSYSIVVMASDMVGNVSITSSTGITLDMTAPELSVAGIEEGGLYNEDKDYTINVSDPGEQASGIESIEVSITAGGEKKEGTKDPYVNSFVLTKQDIEALELKKEPQEGEEEELPSAYRESTGLIVVNAFIKDTDSNDVTASITVTDESGNVYTKEYALMIDKSAPVISGGFTETKDVSSYEKDRKLEVEIGERNYDESLVSFIVTVDDKKGTYSVKDLEEGRAAGIRLVKKEDTEEGVPARQLTDERKALYALSFEGESTYKVSVSAKDLAGNESGQVVFTKGGPVQEGAGEGKESSFTIDKTSPELEMRLMTEGGEDVTDRALSGRYQTVENMRIVLRAKEKHFLESAVSMSFDESEGRTADTSAKDCEDTDMWTRSADGSYTFSAPVQGEGVFTVSVGIKDPAGNTADAGPIRFTIDRTPPELSLQAGGEASMSLLESFIFRIMGRSSIGVSIDASDAVSGVRAIEYLRYDPGRGATGSFEGLTGQELAGAQWRSYGGGLSIDPDSQEVIYARAIDQAGNISYVSSASGYITETTAPVITLSGITEGEYYNANVPVTISVTDPVNGGTWSGLAEVTYSVSADGNVTQQGSYTAGSSERVRDYSTGITIDGTRNNSDNVTVTVTAKDHSGNESTISRNIKIDTRRPQIVISYDRSDARNGYYYNKEKTVSVTVRERNFDPSRVRWNISAAGAPSPEISEWTRTGGEGDDAAYTASIVLSADASYLIDLSVTDAAGNRGQAESSERLVIDRTSPEVKITFDTSAPSGSRFYNKERTARITVTDDNFREDLLSRRISAMLEGRGITAPAISRWEHNGSEHTAVVIFTDDGEYSIRAEASDLAGNTSRTAVSDMFIIDTTPPQIKVSGIRDKAAYRDSIYPVFTATDIHFLQGSVKVEVKGSVNGTVQIPGTRSVVQGGEVYTMEDIPKEKGNDDVYTIKVTASDQAGNLAQETLTISINRFGSSYQTDEQSAAFIEKYYHMEGENIVVYETNLDEIRGHSVILSHNGSLKTLEEGTDYKVEKLQGEGSWKRLKYTIFGSCFEEEGLYEVRISTEDAAGNLQDNTTKSLGIKFVVDRTKPVITVSGLEDKGVYNEVSHVFKVACSDDTAFDRCEVYVDGELVEAVREGEYEIQQKESWQNVNVVSYDRAGNEASVSFRVYVNTNKTAAFFEKNRLIIIGAPFLLLLILLGVITAKKVKKLF